MGALHPPASFFVIRTLIIADRDSHCTKTNKREPIQHTFNNLVENLLKVEKKCSLSLRKFRVFFDSATEPGLFLDKSHWCSRSCTGANMRWRFVRDLN